MSWALLNLCLLPLSRPKTPKTLGFGHLSFIVLTPSTFKCVVKKKEKSNDWHNVVHDWFIQALNALP